LIITVIQQIQGAAGGKPPKLEMGDIYPQLLSPTKKNRRKRSANSLVDWDNTPEHLQKELIQEGLYDEDGNPMGYNPHR
jgi:hypothetical protein